MPGRIPLAELARLALIGGEAEAVGDADQLRVRISGRLGSRARKTHLEPAILDEAEGIGDDFVDGGLGVFSAVRLAHEAQTRRTW